jgi:hypothetical protein
MTQTAGQAEVDTYICIVPSGIVVFAFEDGISQLAIGTGQSIELLPLVYSYDIDGDKDISELDFKIYCQVIDDNVELGYPKTLRSSDDDLLKLKLGLSAVTMNENSTCFRDISMKRQKMVIPKLISNFWAKNIFSI